MGAVLRTAARLGAAPVAAAGATLLTASALLLFAPVEWLDAATAWGDRGLAAALVSFFAAALALALLLLWPRPSAGEPVPPRVLAPASARTYLR